MAVDPVSVPFSSEAGPPSKRRRLGWDVPDPLFLSDAARLQLHLASQLLQVYPSLVSAQDKQMVDSSTFHGDSLRNDTKKVCKVDVEDLRKGSGDGCLGSNSFSPPWHKDDQDGHFNFNAGECLTSRYKILQKMGEGTFGRVLECWDIEAEEVVAIKVVRSAERYREAAMIEIDVLHSLAEKDRSGSRGKAYKYFRHERTLNWPDRHTKRESIRAVERLSELRDLLAKHVEKVPSSLVNLLERMFCYDPLNRLTAREALQHPFFQESSRH